MSSLDYDKFCKFSSEYGVVVHKFPVGKYVCYCGKSTGKNTDANSLNYATKHFNSSKFKKKHLRYPNSVKRDT